MKKGLFFLMFLGLTLMIKGQQNYVDNVFLKNGTIIRGVIIEQILNKSIRIVSTDGDSLSFNMDEIEKRTRGPIPEENKQSNSNFHLTIGYQLVVQGSLVYGIGKFGTNNYKLSIINAIRLNRKFAVGFGVGLGYYPKPELAGSYEKPESRIFPVFIDFRTNFPVSKNVSVYSAFDIGYTFYKKPIRNALSGYKKDFGLLLNTTAGISLKISNISALQFGIGYELQKRVFNEYYLIQYFQSSIHSREVDKLVSSIGIYGGITF